ncbi:hypothetical protein EB061_10590 [bacterium]|nr:hypothetical protein [bacterium]
MIRQEPSKKLRAHEVLVSPPQKLNVFTPSAAISRTQAWKAKGISEQGAPKERPKLEFVQNEQFGADRGSGSPSFTFLKTAFRPTVANFTLNEQTTPRMHGMTITS